jgi:D-alanine-D-alanine ligase
MTQRGEAVVGALTALGHPVARIFAGPGLERQLRASGVEVVFLALHGRMGEDGKIQELLEGLELPYTGSGVLASAAAMNKPVARRLFAHHNVPVASGYTVGERELSSALVRHGDLGFPCVVKPARGGSTAGGLSRVCERAQLLPALAQACRHGGEALVERSFEGRQLTIGILDGQVLGSCELAAPDNCGSPRLSATRVANLEALALRAYECLGCRGYGGVALIASDEGNEVVLEVNTLPVMTQTGVLPKIAARAGLSFEALVAKILGLAALDALPLEVGARLAS